MKKSYLKPVIEITEFKTEDIIRTSGGPSTKTLSVNAKFTQWGIETKE